MLNETQYEADLRDDSLSIRQVAQKHSTTFNKVQRARKALKVTHSPASPGAPVFKGSSDPRNGKSYELTALEPWGESHWRDWLTENGTDPDKVSFSFGVTTNPQGGYWNKLNNVKPLPGLLNNAEYTFSEDYISSAVTRLQASTETRPVVSSKGVPVAAVLNLSDMQLFKSEGGGVDATIDRLLVALDSFEAHVDEVRARGWNLNELVIVNNGDPFEGLAGNYSNQAHTVQGGLRAQMNLVLEVWTMFAKRLYPMFEKRQFVTVLCNHTQFGRQGGAKNSISGDEDNGSAFLAETLERILHATEEFRDVEFTIPHDEMNVFAMVAGVPVGFNHGHKIPKSDAKGFESWLNGQVRYDKRAYEARLWITAHRHNFQMFDLGSTSVLQCPSCDGGSKWLTDTTGTHSNSGVASILVGEHHRLGWSDVRFM